MKDMFGMTVYQRIEFGEKYKEEGFDDDGNESARQGGAGEMIIFKLRCKDITLKKDTKIMTLEEDKKFIFDIHDRLDGLRDLQYFISPRDAHSMR